MTSTEHHAAQAALRKLIEDTAADLSQAEPFWTAGCLATALIAKGVTTSTAFAAREADLVGALRKMVWLQSGMPMSGIQAEEWTQEAIAALNSREASHG